MNRWLVIHSILCVSVTFYTLHTRSPLALVCVGVLTFGALVFFSLKQKNTAQLVNPANGVSVLRLIGVFFLASFGIHTSDAMIILFCVVLILLDCLDGWLARSKNVTTEFGAFFDKEIDAYFLLILCLLLVLKGTLGSWFLSNGLLRYFYAIIINFFITADRTEERTSRARHIFTAVMILILALFLPIWWIKLALAIVICALLFLSFGIDLLKILHGRSQSHIPKAFAVDKLSDISDFFDRIASDFTDSHGNPDKLLRYRIKTIRKSVLLDKNDTILEIGCGHGQHLLALMEKGRTGRGIDISIRMIEEARKNAAASPYSTSLTFDVDDAQRLATVQDESVDIVLCVGAIEHMPDKHEALKNVFRVLKTRGRFLCLTPNGRYCWYTWISPRLRINTKHLSSDGFITSEWIEDSILSVGLKSEKIGYWSFVPRGDMPAYMGGFLQVLDFLGRIFGISTFRGGILFAVVKP